jgi:hypothetical protein
MRAGVGDVADAREHRFDVPFNFTGKINKVTFNLGEERLTAAAGIYLSTLTTSSRDA